MFQALKDKFLNQEQCQEQSCHTDGGSAQLRPPNREEIGRAAWAYLHARAAGYQPAQAADELKWVVGFTYLYPCQLCASAFFEDVLSVKPPTLNSTGEYENWWVWAHNVVNQDLSKPITVPNRGIFANSPPA